MSGQYAERPEPRFHLLHSLKHWKQATAVPTTAIPMNAQIKTSAANPMTSPLNGILG
jgi:hypothetical protein